MGSKSHKLLAFFSRFIKPGGTLVEIGSERGDGSTAFLDALCQRRGLRFVSVDADPNIVERAKAIVGDRAIWGTGESYLEKFPDKVSIAYLDKFDWDWGNHPEIIKKQASGIRRSTTSK